MKKAYIYCLKDTEGNIRYIGKTINIKKRLSSHINEAKRGKSRRHVCHWIKQLITNNQLPIIEIIEVCDDSNWQEKEIYWINHYRAILDKLCNNANGGLGGSGKKNYTKEELEERAISASTRFSRFNNNEKQHIWTLIQENKSIEDIKLIYPNYTRHIHFQVSNGRQWNDITGKIKTVGKTKRRGYTFFNGYYRIRDKNRKTLLLSKDEEVVKKYLTLLEANK